MNKTTIGDPSQVGVEKTSEVRAALLDLRHIVLTLASRPTHASKLVEYKPELAGTCDMPLLLEPGESGSAIQYNQQYGASSGPKTWPNYIATERLRSRT